MILVNMRGGLGNQMFCYALGRHLDIRTSHNIKYDYIPPYEMHIDEFAIDIEMATESDIKSVCRTSLSKAGLLRFGDYVQKTPYGPRVVAKLFNTYFEMMPDTPPQDTELTWPHHRKFCPDILDIDTDAYLFGYWQSPKYFNDIRSTLRKELRVASLDETNRKMAQQIQATESVAVHVRRGDLAEQGDTDSLRYFVRAIDQISERLESPHFFLFSDEPEFVRETLDIDYPSTLVNQNGPDTPHLDMDLLRRCDHHIISSSTFSWWGAWLNDNETKIVLVPKPFTTTKYSVEEMDLIPERWEFISNN